MDKSTREEPEDLLMDLEDAEKVVEEDKLAKLRQAALNSGKGAGQPPRPPSTSSAPPGFSSAPHHLRQPSFPGLRGRAPSLFSGASGAPPLFGRAG